MKFPSAQSSAVAAKVLGDGGDEVGVADGAVEVEPPARVYSMRSWLGAARGLSRLPSA